MKVNDRTPTGDGLRPFRRISPFNDSAIRKRQVRKTPGHKESDNRRKIITLSNIFIFIVFIQIIMENLIAITPLLFLPETSKIQTKCKNRFDSAVRNDIVSLPVGAYLRRQGGGCPNDTGPDARSFDFRTITARRFFPFFTVARPCGFKRPFKFGII